MLTKKEHRGFTLIELLVVISIISLLSSVVLASLSSARMKARDTLKVQEAKQLRTALEMYFNDNGSYPRADTEVPLSNTTFKTALAPYLKIDSNPLWDTIAYINPGYNVAFRFPMEDSKKYNTSGNPPPTATAADSCMLCIKKDDVYCNNWWNLGGANSPYVSYFCPF